ncbi:MAG: hypothetical protein R3E96_09135 [Planctomycetota bacterium]
MTTTTEHIGHTQDGRQFFLTTPFEPAIEGSAGCEYIALYLFDAGRAIARGSGSIGLARAPNFDRDAARAATEALGFARQGDPRGISASPCVERFGTEFGLIPRDCEHPDDVPAVILMPGDYMAFFEPWEGYYDT